jgi:hypothetical protein
MNTPRIKFGPADPSSFENMGDFPEPEYVKDWASFNDYSQKAKTKLAQAKNY